MSYPKATQPKVSPNALFLMKEIAAGRNQIWRLDAQPPGSLQLLRFRYITRCGDSAALTCTGEAYLARVSAEPA